MIELDKTLAPVCKLANQCYEELFPGLPMFPKFSFTRAMITVWKSAVYGALATNLLDAFNRVLLAERREAVQRGELKTKEERYVPSSQRR